MTLYLCGTQAETKSNDFLLKTNSFHPTNKFTAEISETETTFLDTKVYKGVRFNKESILDVRTHFKSTETFQYTRRHERLYQRRNVIKASENKFLLN